MKNFSCKCGREIMSSCACVECSVCHKVYSKNEHGEYINLQDEIVIKKECICKPSGFYLGFWRDYNKQGKCGTCGGTFPETVDKPFNCTGCDKVLNGQGQVSVECEFCYCMYIADLNTTTYKFIGVNRDKEDKAKYINCECGEKLHTDNCTNIQCEKCHCVYQKSNITGGYSIVSMDSPIIDPNDWTVPHIPNPVKVKNEEEFMKYDGAKPMMALLPPLATLSVSRVLTHGAIKYNADNWAKVESVRKYMSALRRHVACWLAGEDVDPESGETHLAHLMCSALFLEELYQRGLMQDIDDRWRGGDPKVVEYALDSLIGGSRMKFRIDQEKAKTKQTE